MKKKDIFNILSIISIVLFAIVILGNVIFVIWGSTLSGDPTGNGQAMGMLWALLVVPASMHFLFASIITSLISVVAYFISIVRKIEVNKKKTILVIVNIIQIILIVIGLIMLINFMA